MQSCTKQNLPTLLLCKPSQALLQTAPRLDLPCEQPMEQFLQPSSYRFQMRHNRVLESDKRHPHLPINRIKLNKAKVTGETIRITVVTINLSLRLKDSDHDYLTIQNTSSSRANSNVSRIDWLQCWLKTDPRPPWLRLVWICSRTLWMQKVSRQKVGNCLPKPKTRSRKQNTATKHWKKASKHRKVVSKAQKTGTKQWKLVTESWKLQTANWKLKLGNETGTGNRRLEIRRLGIGRLEIGRLESEKREPETTK